MRPLPGPLAWPPRSAYLHLPFCHRRCFYCDFPVVPLGDRADGDRSPSIAAYLKLLHAEIAAAPPGPPLSTVYLGGGTPSLLTPAQVGALLEALRRRYGLAPGAEVSLELDPAGFDEDRLVGYLAEGVNRVSLGGQSFDDEVLARLGRRHRRADLLAATGWLRRARRGGRLRSWSLDLIQGLPTVSGSSGSPGRTLTHWRGQLDQAIAEGPPHLSIYDLIVEPGTVFERQREQGRLALPDDDLAADLMDLTVSRLRQAGYGRYEISNHALPGHASRHNRVYWSGAGWWGFGMGATAAPDGRREARPRTRDAYAAWLRERLEAGPDAGAGPEGSASAGGTEGVAASAGPLGSAEPEGPPGMPADERLMVGLRRREGVDMGRLLAEQGLAPAELEGLLARLAPFRQRDLLRVEGRRWRLSDPEGLALSNGVLRELLAWWSERCPGAAAPAPGPPPSPSGPPPPAPARPAAAARTGAAGG